MELIVLIGLLIALAVASALWGADSRVSLPSKEWEQAALGLSWPEQVVPTPHLRPERGALATLERVRIARRVDRLRRAPVRLVS
jgi:hypothetical protein